MKWISIVAATENNVIGIDNKMPWHLPKDLKFFKNTTLGAPIVMGKNTWLSLNSKPLPNRLNIVISTSLQVVPEGVVVVNSFEAAFDFLKNHKDQFEKVFIIGGGQLYKHTMNTIQEMYITRIHTVIENGMVFFPSFNKDEWNCIWQEDHYKDEKHEYDFTFEHWIRK